jgi:hypothetical protein
MDAKDFANDETNRRLNGQVLDTKAEAIGAKKWLQTRMQFLSRDFEAATCVETLAGQRRYVDYVAFCPTAPLLTTGSSDSTVKLCR